MSLLHDERSARLTRRRTRGPATDYSSTSPMLPGTRLAVKVLGRFASPDLVLGRPRRSTRVRLASLAPSGLVWLATRPSTEAELTHCRGRGRAVRPPAPSAGTPPAGE